MPKKLKRCVKKVKKQGHDTGSAFAICVKSTGQKPHRKSKKRGKKK